MEKSKLYRLAQMAVLAYDRLPDETKLKIISELQDRVSICEMLEEKEGDTE